MIPAERYVKSLEKDFSTIKNGFKEIEERALADFRSKDKAKVVHLARLTYRSELHQVRMYAVFLFGYLSDDATILKFLKEEVAKDDNWRVQEILAKAFDEYCRRRGYGNSLGTIDDWLQSGHPNTRRAVTEGLRIWTSRDFFREHPEEAIARLASLKQDASEYVRKSVGNALRDISKKHPDALRQELSRWNLDSKEIRQVYKLASKCIDLKKQINSSFQLFFL